MALDVESLVRRDGNVDEGTARAVLVHQLQQHDRSPIDQHAVWWNSSAWIDAPQHHDESSESSRSVWSPDVAERLRILAEFLDDGSREDGWRRISRDAVFQRRESDIDLFLAAMAFGFGDRGYGWRRTADVLRAADPQRVAQAVAELGCAASTAGAEGVWRAWARDGKAKLWGLDTAFASKLAYFACYDRANGSGPLICDANTTWAFWALTGRWDSRTDAELYASYVTWAERWAKDLKCRSDDIERALFELGTPIRRAWTGANSGAPTVGVTPAA